MKLMDRMDTLEEHLSPKELVILWMREAHEFGDLATYGRWLLEQPDDAYPLIRLPRLLYERSPVSGRRVCEPKEREALRGSYRDLLFLYHLHNQANERVLGCRQELLWRALWAAERRRTLLEQHRSLEAASARERKRAAFRRERDAFRESLTVWRGELSRLSDDLCALLGAAELLSDRYFAGEDLIFPEEFELLAKVAEELDALRFTDLLTFSTPAERTRLLAPLEGEDLAGDDDGEEIDYPPSPAARALARELVVLARAEAMATLGEHNRGVDLVAEWMRTVAR